MGIITAKEGTPDAAVHHVIPRGVGEGNEGGTGFGHGVTLTAGGGRKAKQKNKMGVLLFVVFPKEVKSGLFDYFTSTDSKTERS